MSLQELARRSGVSFATISRAFNHPEKVHPDTLAKIRKLCDDLNYRPRVIPNRLNTVSLIVPPSERFHPGDGVLMSSIINRLTDLSIPTMVTTAKALQNRPSLFQKAFIAIMRRDDPESTTLMRQYASQGPFIAINDFDEKFSPDAVYAGSDHAAGVRIALEHCWSRGHRRIGFVHRQSERTGHIERLRAFRDWIAQHDIRDDSLIFFNHESYLFEGLRRICDAGATAILVADGELTLPALHNLKMLGRSIPQDMSVVAQEMDGGNVKYLFPPVTCMIQPTRQVAHACVDTMIKLLNSDRGDIPARIKFAYDFVDRESVRPITPT